MPKQKAVSDIKDIQQCPRADKDRVNNPSVGLVTHETDKDSGKKTYSYDPHLDPQLQWAGKFDDIPLILETVVNLV